jgi:SAM-dependent methyltransferase
MSTDAVEGLERSAATPVARRIAGDEYIAAIQARSSDRRVRLAFQDLVLHLSRPGSCIFDFGAGPGIDAKLYAERGRQVIAYEVDSQMCEAFNRHCGPEIAAGQVVLYQADYRDFLARQTPEIRQRQAIGLVTANFAPLNLIEDLHALFAALHALTAPGALLLASVLNPGYLGDLQYRWWWAHRWEYWRAGHFCIQGAHGHIFRRSCRDLASLAKPYFMLQSLRGPPVIRGSRGPLALARYLFVLFSRQ